MFSRPKGIVLKMVRNREGRDDVSSVQGIQKRREKSPHSPPLSDIFVEKSYWPRKRTNESSDAGKLVSSLFF